MNYELLEVMKMLAATVPAYQPACTVSIVLHELRGSVTFLLT
jgi:hypothetical protein